MSEEKIIESQDIFKALWSSAVNLGTSLAKICFLGSVLLYSAQFLFKDRVLHEIDQMANLYIAPLKVKLTKIELQLNKLDTPELLVIRGKPLRVTDDPVEPGSRVSFVYSLKRLATCETDIVVRFFSRDLARIDSFYNYVIPGIKAPVTDRFIDFTVDVRIPDNLPDGFWAYSPVAIPIDCEGFGPIEIIRTEFFEVKRK